MNYLSIYKQIIRKAKRLKEERKKAKKNGEYFENHHVIPKAVMLIRKPWSEDNRKSTNWINGKWNMILLTAREHYLIHRMLVKICDSLYGETHIYSIKMLWSFVNISHLNDKIKINSKEYGRLKDRLSKEKSIHFTGENNPMWGMCGDKNPRWGKTGVQYWLGKKRPYNKRKPRPDISGDNHPAAKTKRKTGMVTYDNGKTEIIIGIKKFCRERGYNPQYLNKVKNGIWKFHKNIVKFENL